MTLLSRAQRGRRALKPSHSPLSHLDLAFHCSSLAVAPPMRRENALMQLCFQVVRIRLGDDASVSAAACGTAASSSAPGTKAKRSQAGTSPAAASLAPPAGGAVSCMEPVVSRSMLSGLNLHSGCTHQGAEGGSFSTHAISQWLCIMPRTLSDTCICFCAAPPWPYRFHGWESHGVCGRGQWQGCVHIG